MKKFFDPSALKYDHLLAMAAFMVAIPMVIWQVLKFSYPLGYAGMYTLIAEKIAENNFLLPMSISHYGPGGIPLVYPPFAFYIFALTIKMGVSIWTYLRFVPAIFTLFAVIPLYFLAVALLRSGRAGFFTVIFVLSSPAIYYTHVWAGGVVRALALFFCLAGLYFYVRSLEQFSWRTMLASGVFLGLLLMTHWLYVLFASIFGAAYLLANWRTSRVLRSMGILLISILLTLPWFILILERHGFASIWIAYSSHGNVDVFQTLNDPFSMFQFINANLGYVTDNLFNAVLVFPGFIWLLLQRKYSVPLAFCLVLFMGEAVVFITILAAMMAGMFVAEILGHSSPANNRRIGTGWGVLGLFVLLCSLLSVRVGIGQIALFVPEINDDYLDTASYVNKNIDPEATYLFVGRINEAEWFPYLSDHTPVFALWGSEWKGIYAEQTDILISLRECELNKSWVCMEKIQSRENVYPDFLVIPNKRWLIEEIKVSDSWRVVYKNEGFLVFLRRD